MKRLFVPALALSVGLMSTGFAAKAKSTANMSDDQKQSYAAGFAQGGQLHKMDTDLGVKFDMTSFQKGFNDAYKNAKPALAQEEMEKSLVALQKSIMEKQRTFMQKQFTENKKKGEDFLATKASAKDMQKIAGAKPEDTIYYEVVKSGDGKTHPAANSSVIVSYVGTTVDGTEFDKNNDVKLSLDNLIQGWKTALQKMSPGDKWKLYIPASQAYGENGAPGIMPNSTLVFDIELKKIVDDKDAAVSSDQSSKNATNKSKS